jgi:universal stress protein E
VDTKEEETMNVKSPTVVIGTTLGEASDPVVATGAEIARAMGATIHLVHAFEVPTVAVTAAPFAPLVFEAAPGWQQLEPAALTRMDEQIARLRIAGGPLVQHVEQGPPHRVLAAVARRETADLIVVGAADTLAAHVFGSTASRMVRKAQCPLVVVRGALPVPPRKVLLPVDLSPISGEALTRGLALLDCWCGIRAGAGATGTPGAAGARSMGRKGTKVEALHVVVPVGYEGFVPHFDLAGAERASAERLGDFLAAAGSGCSGWQVVRQARFGGPREEILNHVAATRPDLVVMGTHGLSGFERFLLGSVAEAVVRDCRASVLVIPPLAAAVTPAGAKPAMGAPGLRGPRLEEPALAGAGAGASR